MNSIASPELFMEPGVADFLKRHDAGAAFQTALELVRKYFPDVMAVRVSTIEDPDEDNHTWVALDIRVPIQDPEETFRKEIDGFNMELGQRLGFLYHPLSFSLSVNLKSSAPAQIVAGARHHLQTIGRLGKTP